MAGDTPDARPLGERLLAAGVPVVVVRHGGKPPTGWQRITADQCDLSSYRPGKDALALVGGHGIDLVDEDTKDGGSADNLPPFKHFGVTRTPTGGRHFVVPSNGLGKVSPLATGAGHVGDYVGGRPDGTGRLLGFLPGSVRAKAEHEGRAYVEEEAWDVEGCLAAEPDPDLTQALARCGASRERPAGAYDGPGYDDLPDHHKARADDWVADLVEKWRARYDEARGWDEGDKDADGRGWERLATDGAWALMCAALAPWTGLTEADAEDAYEAILPAEIASDDACKGKWNSDRLARAAEAPVMQPPWVSHPSAEDDFDVVGVDNVEAGAGGGWAPLDLAATVAGLLDGTITRPEPTVGCFGDGCLFYAGRINSVHGDSTGGKTWTALVTATQELAKGETVVYVDLEDTAAGIVSRLLLDLGAAPEAVAERFVYLHPDEPLTPAAARGLAALLDARRPSLVVVDSTGEALAIEGANPNADEEVANWFRLLPRLAVRCGAAVLLLDHATKAGDNDLWPIGSQRKRAAVTGAAYLQKVATPFGQDQDGKAVLVCAKDRHGNYPLRRRVAALTVRGGAIALEPEQSTSPAGDFRPTGYMEKVSLLLEAADGPLTGRNVTDAVTGKKGPVTAALDALVREGYARREPGPRGSHLHTIVRPYREADQGGDLL